MLTTTATALPLTVKRPCKPCAGDTDHAVCQPTYGFKKETYREITCLTCGTKTPQALISPWERV